jgi:hypothetical protein
VPQYRVGLVCNDSRVLPELSNRLKEPWSTIVEKEGTFYWSSTHFDALATVPEVDECATRLLPRLNGLVKLHFIDAGELVKAGRIKFIDDQGRELTQVTLSISARAAFTIHGGENPQLEARQRWLNIAEKSLEEREDSPINQALSYYGKERTQNWRTLFKVYETIRREYNHSRGITNSRQFVQLPEEWIQDETGESRERDFAESANNAYLSGYTARHSLAASHPVIMIPDSTHVKVIYPGNREIDIHPMTLEEAKIFIAHLLTYWLTQKFSIAASCSGEADS